MKKAFSKKASGTRTIRGIRVGGGGPAVHGPFLTCAVCKHVVPPALWDNNPFTGTLEPLYGPCINGHAVIDQLRALIA